MNSTADTERETMNGYPLEGWERPWLDAIANELGAGWCAPLRTSLATTKEAFSKLGSEASKAEWLALSVKAEALFAIESRHGRGSALNLEHADVVYFRQRIGFHGHQFITDAEISAAGRYRARVRTASAPQGMPSVRSRTEQD